MEWDARIESLRAQAMKRCSDRLANASPSRVPTEHTFTSGYKSRHGL